MLQFPFGDILLSFDEISHPRPMFKDQAGARHETNLVTLPLIHTLQLIQPGHLVLIGLLPSSVQVSLELRCPEFRTDLPGMSPQATARLAGLLLLMHVVRIFSSLFDDHGVPVAVGT
jgi:hypothetical protein